MPLASEALYDVLVVEFQYLCVVVPVVEGVALDFFRELPLPFGVGVEVEGDETAGGIESRQVAGTLFFLFGFGAGPGMAGHLCPDVLHGIYFICKLIRSLPSSIKIMRLRNPVNQQVLTGTPLEPTTSLIMQQRVNAIKYRATGRSFNVRKSQADISLNIDRTINRPSRVTIQAENDQFDTNFWPLRPTVTSAQKRAPETLTKRSQDNPITRPKSHSLQSRKFKGLKAGRLGKTGDAVTYGKQLKLLGELYELLAGVLAGIKVGFEDIERAVCQYGQYIMNPQLQFIDDFLESAEAKVKKTIRISRIHEYLSIAYLFLEIAQERIENNESDLINFIGFCLSNLIFLTRIYILFERRPEYEDYGFEKQVEEFEITSYGQPLHNIDDVLLRMQHNNQIITMIHKRLGRNNEKFEECIKLFLRNAERKKYTTCLCSHYIFEYLSMHIHESELLGISQFLQVAPTPYLAPPTHDYTLVFEPIGIIKHGVHLRPYLMQFIKWTHKHFDIVLWTWEMPFELEPLAELLDPYLFAKLYRYHCIIKDGVYTKDLHRLGRDLQKTILIDFDERIFAPTPKNGIVCRWRGKAKQKGLLVLSQILEQMLSSESSVEEMLTFYSEELHAIKGI